MKTVLYFLMAHWEIIIVGFSLLIILAILVFLYLKLREKLMSKIVYRRVFSDVGAYEGETVTLIETIYNPNPLPVFFINIEGYIYNGIPMEEYEVDPKKGMQYYVSRFHLMPFMQIRRRHVIRCAKRGYYKLETVDIYYNRKVRYIEAPADIYVYPKILPITEPAQPTSSRQGECFTRRWLIRDPFSFNGVRDYHFGDPFNTINFKATARSGNFFNLSALKVNNRDFCSNRTFMVYLNFQTNADEQITTRSYEAMMEQGLSFAAALTREAAYNGYRTGFAANCCTVTGEDHIRFPIKSGEQHLEEILKEMAKVRSRVGISFYSMLETDVADGISDTEIYIITPMVNEQLDEQAAHFRRFGNSVSVLKLEDELKAEEDRIEREKMMRRQKEADEAKKRLREEKLAAEKARAEGTAEKGGAAT